MSILHFEFLLWKCIPWTHLKSGSSRLILDSMSKNISYKLSSSCVFFLKGNRISWTNFSVKLEYFVLINLVKGSRFVLLFRWPGPWKEAVSLVESPLSLSFFFLISSIHKALIQNSKTLSKRGRRSVTLSPNIKISLVKLDSNDVNCLETYTEYFLYIFIIILHLHI